LSSAPPVLQWFAHERLLHNRAHLLTGLGGSSKTTVLYHLGIGTVTGRVPWGWAIPNTGAALLLLAEDDAESVHRALAAHAAHGGLSAQEKARLGRDLHVYPMAGQNCRLLAAVPGGALAETPQADGLFSLAQSIPNLRFIGLDPAIALSEGDEMNPAHQRRLGELVDRLAIEMRACVVLVSHAAKAVNASDELNSHTSRGSGAITDAVRGEIALRTMTATEARKYGITDPAERKAHLQLAMTKANAAPPDAFVPVWLKRGQGGVLELAEIVPQEGESDVIRKRDTEALAALCDLARTGTPDLSTWRDECLHRGILKAGTYDSQKKAMQRITQTLLTHDLIERGMGRGVFVPKGGD
jgi:RecA-family ATPase